MHKKTACWFLIEQKDLSLADRLERVTHASLSEVTVSNAAHVYFSYTSSFCVMHFVFFQINLTKISFIHLDTARKYSLML